MTKYDVVYDNLLVAPRFSTYILLRTLSDELVIRLITASHIAIISSRIGYQSWSFFSGHN